MKPKLLIGILLTILIYACSSKTEKQGEEKAAPQNSSSGNNNDSYQNSSTNYSDEESNEETEVVDDDNSNGCKFEDGTYSATVDYSNSETGYSATYTLDVEVQDCQVVQINFPNDGYLDEDHISYADIDENGNAYVDGEDGKSYEIQIDN
jgi:hypothetical protein